MSAQAELRPLAYRFVSALSGASGKLGSLPRLPALVTVYLAIAAVSIAMSLMADGAASAVASQVPSGLALIAVLFGIRLHRPANRWPWVLLALGLAAFTTGDFIWLTTDLRRAGELPPQADSLYLAGYILSAVGVGLFIAIRRIKNGIARLVDAVAVGLVCGTLLVLEPLIAHPGLQPATVATGVAYLLAGAALIVVATFLLIGDKDWGWPARIALFVGLSALTAADVFHARFLLGTDQHPIVLDGLRMVGYLAIGTAALLPGMRDLTARATGAGEGGAIRATIMLVCAVAVVTVWDINDEIFVGVTSALTEALQVALLLLVFVRAHEALSLEALQERRLAGLLANASGALAVLSPQGVVRLANPAAESVIGIPSRVLVGRSIFDFVDRLHPEDRAINTERLMAVLATPGARTEMIVRLVQPGGSYRWVEVTAANRLADRSVAAVVMNFRDITDQRQADQLLKRLGTAIDQASDAVIVTDADARIEYVNPAFEQITGYTRDEVIGRNPRILKSGEQKPRFYESMWHMLTDGKPWRADFVNRRKDGTLYRTVGAITPLRDETGQLTGYVGVQRDVTRQRELEQTAHRFARERTLIAEMIRGLDPRESPEKIAQSVCDQLTTMSELALAGLFIFDADGYATQYGLSARDFSNPPRRRLPRARTKYLRERSAAGPWIEAWSNRPGHPYAAMIGRLDIVAHAYAPVRDGNQVIGFIVVGIASAQAEERLASMLPAIVEVADISGAQIGVKVAERTALTAERARIAQVIDSRAFFPVYQALVDAQTGRVVGYEALTRFDDGTPPQIRFAEAHQVGLGEKLELAAVAAAIEGAAALPGEMWLNVNASPSTVMDGGGLNYLVGECDRDLVLEVTEHTEITDYQAFRQAVQELGPKVRLAVDDAGAGFASLRHIIELRPAFVKLDRQVIAGIDDDEARQAMVAGLHHFARTTGCWLIAEGVETPAELQALRELDVRYVQGFLLGRPVPAGQLLGAGLWAAVDGTGPTGGGRRPGA